MKAITFLGATDAKDTTYRMPDGREHIAPYFGVALARFYPDVHMMKVFVTEKARAKHWERFQGRVEDYVEVVEAISIPDGRNEDELWSLFETVVAEVDVQEQVIFDITHGFRSLSFLSLLAVAYLREVKDIKLQAVLYGNFEARDEAGRTPVIDLSGFVSLFDWMTAADRFTRFGDAGDLAKRLRAAKPEQSQQVNDLPQVITAAMLRKPMDPTPHQSQQANRLAQLANALEKVSKALRLIRPNEAMSASANLYRQLSNPVVTHSIQANARPFVLLTESITQAYKQLALSFDKQKKQPVLTLKQERDMVDWLLERKQYAQAVAIAREWITSWVMVQMGLCNLQDSTQRKKAEKVLARETTGTIDQIEAARTIYEDLRTVRNDFLHAGKSHNARRAQEMEAEILEICPQLSELKLPQEQSKVRNP